MKVGVIGCGYWGKNIIRVLWEDSKWDLVLCSDTNENRLKEIKKIYPKLEVTSHPEELFANPKIEAIFIVTPVSSHFELGEKSLMSGKHTFIEKPFVTKREEGEALIELSERKKLTLMVGHIFHYVPGIRKIKKILNEEISSLYYIKLTRINLGIHRKEISVLWDLGAHDIGILFYWLEKEPLWIQVTHRNTIITHVPDVAFINLCFPPDILVNIHISWLAPSKVREILVVGKEKMILYDDTEVKHKLKIFTHSIEKLNHSSFGEYHLTYTTGEVIIPPLSNVEPLKEELTHFYRCIQNSIPPLTDGKLGLGVVKWLELGDNSIREGGKMIYNKI